MAPNANAGNVHKHVLPRNIVLDSERTTAPKVSLFLHGIDDVTRYKNIDLETLQFIITGKHEISDFLNLEQLSRKARAAKYGSPEYKAGKRPHPYITGNAIFHSRKAGSKAQRPSGVIFQDIDPKDNAGLDIERMAARLKAWKHTTLVLRSGYGIKFAVPVHSTLATYEHARKELHAFTASIFPDIVFDESQTAIKQPCYLFHDPKAYYNSNAEPFQPSPAPEKPTEAHRRAANQSTRHYAHGTNLKRLHAAIEVCERLKSNPTENYSIAWIPIAYGLANELPPEQAIQAFHQISQLDSRYKYEETERTIQDAINGRDPKYSGEKGRAGWGTVFYHIQQTTGVQNFEKWLSVQSGVLSLPLIGRERSKFSRSGKRAYQVEIAEVLAQDIRERNPKSNPFARSDSQATLLMDIEYWCESDKATKTEDGKRWMGGRIGTALAFQERHAGMNSKTIARYLQELEKLGYIESTTKLNKWNGKGTIRDRSKWYSLTSKYYETKAAVLVCNSQDAIKENQPGQATPKPASIDSKPLNHFVSSSLSDFPQSERALHNPLNEMKGGCLLDSEKEKIEVKRELSTKAEPVALPVHISDEIVPEETPINGETIPLNDSGLIEDDRREKLNERSINRDSDTSLIKAPEPTTPPTPPKSIWTDKARIDFDVFLLAVRTIRPEWEPQQRELDIFLSIIGNGEDVQKIIDGLPHLRKSVYFFLADRDYLKPPRQSANIATITQDELSAINDRLKFAPYAMLLKDRTAIILQGDGRLQPAKVPDNLPYRLRSDKTIFVNRSGRIFQRIDLLGKVQHRPLNLSRELLLNRLSKRPTDTLKSRLDKVDWNSPIWDK